MIFIKGQFRDILTGPGGQARDFGWKPNTIVKDYGRFLAALMKKDFQGQAGIDYMVVGSGSPDLAAFKNRVQTFFNNANENPENLDYPYFEPGNKSWWVWPNPIKKTELNYLDDDEDKVEIPTNTLKVEIKFKKNQPPEQTLVFKEFALMGIDRDRESGGFITQRLFLINYVIHGPITKDRQMVLTRTVKLTFPINQ
jgi:hypothetical protein